MTKEGLWVTLGTIVVFITNILLPAVAPASFADPKNLILGWMPAYFFWANLGILLFWICTIVAYNIDVAKERTVASGRDISKSA